MASPMASPVIVVGGGVVGLSIGALLAGRLPAPVVVLAADGSMGTGASGCAPALLVPPAAARARRERAARAGWDLWPRWDRWIAAQSNGVPLLRAVGIRRCTASGDAAERSDGGWLPGALHLAALRAALLQGGGQIEATAVTRIAFEPPHARVHAADGRVWRAGAVVVAAGVGTPALLPAGVQAGIAARAQRGIALRLTGGGGLSEPLHAAGIGLTPTADGSGVWVTADWPEDVALWDAAADAQARATRLLQAQGHAARMARSALVWGARPRARGGGAVVWQAVRQAPVWVATGHGRNGFLLAPLTAVTVAIALGVPLPSWVPAAQRALAATLLGMLPPPAAPAKTGMPPLEEPWNHAGGADAREADGAAAAGA